MRIISGKFKGRKIQPPTSLRARPTTDFAKEALFNILVNEINLDDSRVLDLFCGSGSISFEFISRGAIDVWSVDLDRRSLDFVRKYADQLEMTNLKTIKADSYRFLTTCKEKFDLVFADPPYNHDHVFKLPDKIFESGVLLSDGLIVIEHGEKFDFKDTDGFQFHRNYGNVNFSFFRKEL